MAFQNYIRSAAWQFAALLLLLAGCGGSDGPSAPSITISGRVTSTENIPIPNLTIDMSVRSYCPTAYPPYSMNYTFNSTSSTDSNGHYRVTTYIEYYCENYFSVSVHPFDNCSEIKENPCYDYYQPESSPTQWNQYGFSPSTNVNFVGERLYKAFSMVVLPDGTPARSTARLQASMRPMVIPWDGTVDDNGMFTFTRLRDGETYTIYFDPYDCPDIYHYGCNGAYDFDPPEITFTIASTDVENLIFTATPK